MNDMQIASLDEPEPLTPERIERLLLDKARLEALGKSLSQELDRRVRRVILSDGNPSLEEQVMAENALAIATKAIRVWSTWVCTAAEHGNEQCAAWLLEQAHRITENFHRLCQNPPDETLRGFRAFAKTQATLPVLYANSTDRWKAEMDELKAKLHGGTECPLDPHRELGGKVPDLHTPLNALLLGMHEDVRCFITEYHRLWDGVARRSKGQSTGDLEVVRPAFDTAFVNTYSAGAISNEERWIMMRARFLAPMDHTNYRKWIAEVFGPLAQSLVRRGAALREVETLVENLRKRQREELTRRRGETAERFENRVKVSTEKAIGKALENGLRRAAARLIKANSS